MAEIDSLKWAADIYEDIQKVRIACSNRVSAAEREGKAIPKLLESLSEKLKSAENDVQKYMKQYVEEHSVWPWLSQVKGIGHTLACKLLSQIQDISKFDTVSKLWRFAGMAVIDGQAERLKKGEKAHYNKALKTIMYLIGTALMRANSPYRKIYDDAKEYYTTNRDWTKGHIHLAAMRKMEKVFLSHLWQKWREAEGLPTREEYVFEKLGHTTRYAPEDFI